MKFALVACVALSGCAALPNTVAPELEHMSHATQHFGPNQTKYGVEIFQVTAEWNLTKKLYIDLSEGVALDKRNPYGYDAYGEIYGPREQFTGKIGYRFTVKP